MRYFLTLLCAIGSYFMMDWLTPRIYALHVDIPNMEIAPSIFQFGMVGLFSLIAWNRLD